MLTLRLLPQLLLLALQLAPQQAVGQNVIRLGAIWRTSGIGAIAENLFNRIFLPELNATCPMLPGINETVFEFIEAVQSELFDLKLANEQIANFSRSGCLFIAAYSIPELLQFSTAGIGSGVAGSPSPQAVVHEIAALPLHLAVEGMYAAMKTAFGINGSIGSQLVLVIGDGYQLRDFQQLLASFPGTVYCYQLLRGRHSEVIKQVKATGVTDLLMMAPAQEAEVFLTAAFNSLMLTPVYRWFFYDSRLVDKNDFAGFKVVSNNITSMEYGPIATAINNSLTLTREIYLYDLFSMWLVYLKKIVCKEPGSVNQTYSGMTGQFQLYPNGSIERQDWRMYFYRGLGSERQRIGNWSSSGEFQFTPTTVRVATDSVLRSELNKNTFRVVTILNAPYVQFKKGFENAVNETMYNRLEGFIIDMCKAVLFNMSLVDVEFFLQEDGVYGAKDESGNWNGIIRTLIDGHANLACVTLSETEERSRAIKFSSPVLSFQLAILYRREKQNPLDFMFQFMRPFHVYTWIGVIGSVLVLAVVLAVLHQLSRNAVSFSLYDTIFFSFASLIQGITGTPPDRPSGQIVIAVYWLFAFVVLVAYVTNYAAMRTLERLQADITSLDSLLGQSKYQYGTLAGTSYVDMFANSSAATMQQIYRYMNEDPDTRLPPNLTTALQQVNNASFALVYEKPICDYYSQIICRGVSSGSFGSDAPAFGMPLTAEYDSMVSRAIDSLVSSGERDEIYEEYFQLGADQLPDCRSNVFPDLLTDYIPTEPASFNTKVGALTLSNTLGIAVINLIGCVLTLLLALVEFVFERCRRWWKKRRALKERIDKEEANVTFTGALESTA